MSENEKTSAQEENESTSETQELQDNLVQTHHSIIINGEKLNYTVTCGTIILKEEAVKEDDKQRESEGEKPQAAIFFTAYTKDEPADTSLRPITFSFNGGPGSSSVWLHMGVLGPKRVLLDEEGHSPPPPYRLVENEFSLLGKTDLVFVDPVSTGFSRVVKGEKERKFHGIKKDIESVGDFIRLYLSRYNRWNSPKFLIGESYGTTRAAGLSGYLIDRHSLYLNGLMLVSAIVNFQSHRFDPGNDLPYILFLPAYTATAWYHKKLPAALQEKDLQTVLKEVEQFALGEYTLALMQGNLLSGKEKEKIVHQLARYSGLSEDYIKGTNLRINIHRFTKELLREKRLTVGRLDSRYTGIDRDAVGEVPEKDPSMTAITGPYASTFNHYIRAELGFESDLPYEIINFKVWPWNYSEYENRYVDVSDTMRKAIAANPFMKVFVANGYYDLATPYFASEYNFNHLSLDEELRKNISMGYYDAGHMMYVHLPSLKKLNADLCAFIDNSLKGTG
jgi:carboxypeptidase C (cathepsin A)